MVSGSLLILSIFIWIPATSNNCKYETWRSIHLGYFGTQGVLIVCCYTPTRPARPPGSPVGNRGDYSPARNNLHGFRKGQKRYKQRGKTIVKRTELMGSYSQQKKDTFWAEKGVARRMCKNFMQKWNVIMKSNLSRSDLWGAICWVLLLWHIFWLWKLIAVKLGHKWRFLIL